MAITYPLALPASPPTAKQLKLLARTLVAGTMSPFTGQQQIYEHQGGWWEAQFDLPFLTRAQAEPWLAFLLQLNGRSGTFLLGDPASTSPLGTASSLVVQGAGQSGKTLAISALLGTLKAGDYLQIGTGVTQRLYKNLNDAVGNLLTYSEQFDNAAWTKESTVTVTPNNQTDPLGGSTADTIANTTAGNGVLETSGTNAANGTPAFFSVWLKAPSPVTVRILLGRSGGSDQVQLDCSVTTSWQRFSVAHNATWTGTTALQVIIRNQSASSSFYAWGAQLEWNATAVGTYFVTTTPAGTATLDIWPRLREAPADQAAIVLTNTAGTFRLAENLAEWSIDEAKHYSVTFAALEAI